MPQFKRCWVPYCQNNQIGPARRTRLLGFPRNPKRCFEWLKAIGDKTLASCTWDKLRSRFVCIQHFMPKMITANGRATCNAVPTLFTDKRPALPDTAFKTFLDSVPVNYGRSLYIREVFDTESLLVNSATIDHDYFAVAVPRNSQTSDSPQSHFPAADTSEESNELDSFTDYIKNQPFPKNNQEDFLTKQHTLENLIKELCRLCGQKGCVLIPIFQPASDSSKDVPISTKIDMYLPIKIMLEDSLPVCICFNCLSVLSHWHELYTTCVAAEAVLSKTFGKESNIVSVNNSYTSEVQRNAETQTEETPSVQQNAETQTEEIPSVQQNTETQTEEMPSDLHTDEPPLDPVTDESSLVLRAKEIHHRDDMKENEDIWTNYGESETEREQEDKLFKEEFDKGYGSYFYISYKCYLCQELFLNSEDRNSHIAMCRQLLAICELCGHKVPRRKDLKSHIYSKHTVVPQEYLCDKCDKFFKSTSALKYHLKCIHSAENRPEKYCCELCGFIFKREDSFHMHKSKHEQGKIKSVFQIENFRQKVHSEGSDNQVVYACPVCQEKFSDTLSLAVHVTERKKLKCSLCLKILSCEKRLFLHVCGQWTCQYCLKSFNQKVKWLVHERLHTGEKPIKCRKCDLTFRTWHARKYHEMHHESPFKCTYCRRCFKNKDVFQDHMSSYEGKEFPCHICNKRFSGRRGLSKHLKRHKRTEKATSITE